jgi:hypothetical protein
MLSFTLQQLGKSMKKRSKFAKKRRGQFVTLKNLKTGETVGGKVVQHDSIQGYWVEGTVSPNFLDDWRWYHPSEWEEVT